jgi:hypothetical protein
VLATIPSATSDAMRAYSIDAAPLWPEPSRRRKKNIVLDGKVRGSRFMIFAT